MKLLMALLIVILTSCKKDPRTEILKSGRSYDLAGFHQCVKEGDRACTEMFLETNIALSLFSTNAKENPFWIALQYDQYELLNFLLDQHSKMPITINIHAEAGNQFLTMLILRAAKNEKAMSFLNTLSRKGLEGGQIELYKTSYCDTAFGKGKMSHPLVTIVKNDYPEELMLMMLKGFSENYPLDVIDCEGDSILGVSRDKGLKKVQKLVSKNLERFNKDK